MSIGFLSDAQVAAYGRFDGVPPRSDLERFFLLDVADRDLIGDRRGDHNRLGCVLQATTVRYLGAFLEDPLDVPWGGGGVQGIWWRVRCPVADVSNTRFTRSGVHGCRTRVTPLPW